MRGTVESSELVFDSKIEHIVRANMRLARLQKEKESTMVENNGERQRLLGNIQHPLRWLCYKYCLASRASKYFRDQGISSHLDSTRPIWGTSA